MVKNPSAVAGDIRDMGSIPRSGRSPQGGHGNPLRYSCLWNSVNRGTWWATVHRVAKSWFINNTFFSSQLWRLDGLGVWAQSTRATRFWWEPSSSCRLPTSHRVLRWLTDKGWAPGPFLQGHSSYSWGLHLHDPVTHRDLSKYHQKGVRSSVYGF